MSSFERFEALRGLPRVEQDAVLDAMDDAAEAAWLRRLLAYDREETFGGAGAVPTGERARGAGAVLRDRSTWDGQRLRGEGYRLLGVAGYGASGVVYEAEDVGSGKRVAVKVLRDELLASESVSRFHREAETLARLDHPSIVGVHTVGWTEIGGLRRPFIVMDLVEGAATVAEASRPMVERGAFVEVASLFAEAADAVATSHAAGVVHRDIKPGNLLVDGKGRARVIDFGIAQMVAAPGQRAAMTTAATVSWAGDVAGTLCYMPPEAFRGGEGSELGDVYSLGVCLYEALAGRQPFSCDSGDVFAMMEDIRHGRPASAGVGGLAGGAGGLLQVARRAMQPIASERYASMAELHADLLRFSRGEPVLAGSGRVGRAVRSAARSGRVRVGVAFALLLAVLIAVLVAGDEAPMRPLTVSPKYDRIGSAGERLYSLIAHDAAGEEVDRLDWPASQSGFAERILFDAPSAAFGVGALASYSRGKAKDGRTGVVAWLVGERALHFPAIDLEPPGGGAAIASDDVATLWTDVSEIIGELAGDELVLVSRDMDGSASLVRVIASTGEALASVWFPGEVVAARVWNRVEVGTPLPPRLLVLGHDASAPGARRYARDSYSATVSPARVGPMVIAGVDIARGAFDEAWLFGGSDAGGEDGAPESSGFEGHSGGDDSRNRLAFVRRVEPVEFADVAFFDWDTIRFMGPDEASVARLRLHAFGDGPREDRWEAYDLLITAEGALRSVSLREASRGLGLPTPEELGLRLVDHR